MYQEKYDKKNQIFSKIPRNRSLAWKPSAFIYITYQEPKYDKKNQIFSKIPRNRSLAWKPSAFIYITYQEQKSDKKNQIFSKIPRNRSGSFLRKMSVWKPSPSIYITYQEPEYDKKNQIFSKIPRNRSLARCNCWAIRFPFSVQLFGSFQFQFLYGKLQLLGGKGFHRGQACEFGK